MLISNLIDVTILMVVIAIIIALRPGTFRIQRSARIDSPQLMPK